MTKIIKNYCIGAARFWQAQAIPPNRLCSCFGFVCVVCVCCFVISFMIFVRCESIYRCTSRAKCPKSPTLIRKCFEKYPHAAQHVFYISACYDCKSSLSVSLGQGPPGPSRFTNNFFDSRFWWIHGMNRKCDITTTVQVKICLLVWRKVCWNSFWKIDLSHLLPTPWAGTE